MRLRVLFLARLREVAGLRELVIEVADGSTASLQEALGRRLAKDIVSTLFAESIRIACNQSLWDGTALFLDGDEIAFLPPVTGG